MKAKSSKKLQELKKPAEEFYPDNYPTLEEQLEAWDKRWRLGESKLNAREKCALRTFLEERRALDDVKERILTKRHVSLIRKRVRDFLGEHYLIPTSEDWIGGKGRSSEIIDFLFMKGRFGPSPSRFLARDYQELCPEYWNIMKKYLKRFFRIRSWQREREREHTGDWGYDFAPLDYLRDPNYPTLEEQSKAWEKRIKVGEAKLNKREKYALETFFKEEKEEENEWIRRTLDAVGCPFGWKLGDTNFRYVSFFDLHLKEFWKWTGLSVNENLRFFLGREAHGYYSEKSYEKKWKMPKFSLFREIHHGDYAQFRSQLIEDAKVPKRFFEELENTYIGTQLQGLIPIISRIVRPLFLVAHFLKKEDPKIYDYHRTSTKSYLCSINSGTPAVKSLVSTEVGRRRTEDFLFDAVWQDFLFDRTRYLKKPKAKKDGRGRPPKMSTYLLVYVAIKNGLEKYEAKLPYTVYETTAKLINSLSKEKKFNLTRSPGPKHYYNLGAENVRRIYGKAKEHFEKEIPK